MNIKDKLDIFIITYNRANHIQETLEQILAENSPIKDFDITIIDNNSTDNTAEIIHKYQQQHPNILYKKNRYNIGGNANIARTFEYAQKDYIWVLADNDFYNWEKWYEVEDAINSGKDAVMTAIYECPKYDIAQFFIQMTFLPGVIYKTDLIDENVIANMQFNISNMFPHLAVASRLINEKRDVAIVSKAIVNPGDNGDGKANVSYTRGYSKSSLHPLMKNMNWLSGFANTLWMIEDKKTRNYIAKHNLFYITQLNTIRLFTYNWRRSGGSLYNLLCAFNVLDMAGKIKFLLNIVCLFTICPFVYIFSDNIYNVECDEITKRYRIILFSKLKTTLFKFRRKK